MEEDGPQNQEQKETGKTGGDKRKSGERKEQINEAKISLFIIVEWLMKCVLSENLQVKLHC